MADRARRLSSFPAFSAALRMADSTAARDRVVGGYGLLFASQPPFIEPLCCSTIARAEPSTIHGRVRLQPDQIDLGMLTIITRELARHPVRDQDRPTPAHRIGAHHVQ